MIKLSDKVTGGELTADEWNNHSKELENLVTNAGLILSTNEDDLTKAVDILSKSNYYETTNNGNDYTIIDRGLNVEELKKGMVIVVKFNVANTSIVTLNLNGTAISVKNSDGGDLIGKRFNDGEIISLVYDGTNFLSTRYLYMHNAFYNINNILRNPTEYEYELIKIADILSKSNYYETTNNGNDYTIIDRNLHVEELEKGNIIFVKFNVANNGVVTLNLDGTAISVKNSDGGDLTGVRFKDNEIISLVYDGTNFLSTKYLYKFIDDNVDGLIDYINYTSSEISPYINWDDRYGANPQFRIRIYGYIKEDIANLRIVLQLDSDQSQNTEKADSFTFALGSFITDKLNYPFDILSNNTCTGFINAYDKNTYYSFPISPILVTCFPYNYGSTNYDNRIDFSTSGKPWAWDNTTTSSHDKLTISAGIICKIKRV